MQIAQIQRLGEESGFVNVYYSDGDDYEGHDRDGDDWRHSHRHDDVDNPHYGGEDEHHNHHHDGYRNYGY